MSDPNILRLPTTFNRLAWSNLAAQSAEQVALAVEFGGTAAKETACQAGIAKVEFGTFDESLDAIAEPGR